MEDNACVMGSQEWFDALAFTVTALAPGVLLILATAGGMWLLVKMLLR